MSTVMNAIKKPAFWLSYDKNKLFACSHCGGYALAKTCNCPKCKRAMSNAGGAKK